MTTYNDRIALGQCFNLAHKEMLEGGLMPCSSQRTKDLLKEKTLILFRLKKKIDQEVEEGENNGEA